MPSEAESMSRARRCSCSASASSACWRSSSATARGEDAHDVERAFAFRHRAVVQDREVTDDASVGVDHRRARVRDRAPLREPVLLWEQLLDTLGVVAHLPAEHVLARRPGERDLEGLAEGAAFPQRQRPEVGPLARQLRHERVLDTQYLGEPTHQRAEERVTGLGLDGLHQGA
jgi:hypothetical protein